MLFDTLTNSGDVIFDNLDDTEAQPSITTVGTCTDAASCVLTVVNASESGNKVYLAGTTQTVTDESTTEITFTVDGNNSYRDSSVEIVIEDADGFQSAAKLATLLPRSGYRTRNITVTPPADTTSRIASDPDIEISDQIIYGGVTGTDVDEDDVDVFANGVARRLPEVETMEVYIFDGIETAGPATQTFGPAPEDLVTVPNVVGATQAAATTTLLNNTLIAVVVTAYSASVQEGRVIATQPAAGQEVPEESAVEIVVSLGTAPATMPNVVGQAIGSAASSISSLGLIAVPRYIQDEADFGEVLAQSLAPGSLIEAGTEVHLLVSGGPDMGSETRRPAGRGGMMVYG